MSSVSIKELSLSFGPVSVLRQLDLEVAQGEFLVLLGPSGCGKSTLLNCIAGLLDITDGQIFINGHNVTWFEPKDRGIGMVFQSYALYPQMSVEKNLSFGLRVAGFPREEISERVSRAAEILQIESLLKRKPAALSGGQRQRVAIGRALVRDVDVFLFDEPLSNLDARLRTDLRVELKRLHKRLGNTMIYVTHDQIEAMTLADRIAIMKSGIIQQLDTPKDIYLHPMNRFVAGFVGSPSMNFLQGTLQKQTDQWFFTTENKTDDGSADIWINLQRYVFSKQPAIGQRIEFGVRPEHAHLQASTDQSQSELEFFVELIEHMGSEAIAWGNVSGHSFAIKLDADNLPQSNTRIKACFDAQRASLFDAESGQRI